MIIAMFIQNIKKYQPNPERLGIVACLPGEFGRLSMGWVWSGCGNGRLSAAPGATSVNEDHEPRSTTVARFALSPPIGILQMDVP